MFKPRKYRLLSACFLLFFGSTMTIFAQENLSVPTSHKVYSLIETAEIRGLVTKLSQVKPYTKRQIVTLLKQIDSQRYALTEQERKVLDFYLETFAQTVVPDAGIVDNVALGRFDFAGFNSTASLGLSFDLTSQFAAEDFNEFYLRAPMKIYARGDFLNSMFSYNADIHFSSDRLRKFPFAYPTFWQPAGFGFHQSSESQDAGDAVTGPKVTGYEMRPEVTGMFFDDRIMTRIGIIDGIRIGNGTKGLALSDTSAPYWSAELDIRLFPSVNLYAMTAQLGDFRTDAKNIGRGTDDNTVWVPGDNGNDRQVGTPAEGYIQNSKMISYHTGEFFISDYFYASVYETVVWGTRLDLGYVNPLSFYMFHQNLLGDLDNMAAGFSVATIAPGVGKFWFEFFADELYSKIELSHPRMITALQAGARFNIPWIPFGNLTLQYTKIEPFVYSHYNQSYSFNGSPKGRPDEQVFTDTGFTTQGKGLGPDLKPNSDEFLLRLETTPLPGFTTFAGYQLIRHGSLPLTLVVLRKDGWVMRYQDAVDKHYEWYGDPYWGYDPTKMNGEYGATYPYEGANLDEPRRRFLKDGIYDWTNIFSIGASYDFRTVTAFHRKVPVVLSLEYQFANTFFVLNGIDPNGYTDIKTGKEIPTIAHPDYNNYEKYSKNIFILKFTIFPYF